MNEKRAEELLAEDQREHIEKRKEYLKLTKEFKDLCKREERCLRSSEEGKEEEEEEHKHKQTKEEVVVVVVAAMMIAVGVVGVEVGVVIGATTTNNGFRKSFTSIRTIPKSAR